MGPLDDLIIQNILRTDSSGKVLQKEDDKIEYKEVFENNSKDAKAKYAKEMAALYNYDGGYLIFGISDSSDLVGLQSFKEPDNADLANDINNYFSPAIRFQSRLVKVNGKDVFVIYVEKRSSIPTVCIKGHQDAVKEATIYWRYSAKSAPINSGDLINLFHSLRGEETKKLTEIAEKDYRAKHKPRIWTNGGGITSSGFGGDERLKISVDNSGEVCYLDNFEIIEGDKVSLTKWHDSIPIQKNAHVQITGILDDKNPRDARFKIKLYYHDQENYKYESVIEWNRMKTKLVETKEL